MNNYADALTIYNIEITMEIPFILTRIAIIGILSLFSFKSFSIDIVKLQIHQLSKNKSAHNIEVIRRALEITEPEYSSFKLEIVKITMSSTRMLKLSVEGKLFNTVIVPAKNQWDKQLIAIQIPVRLGLLNYRLLLVNKADLPKFKKVSSLQELKKLTAGLTDCWETTKILKTQGFNMVETGHFDGIFLMLKKQRFDYLPRGIYEIYDELESRQPLLENVVVEPTLALNIPMLSYVYVSPKEPRIAKRIESGLHKLLVSGELKELLYKHFSNDINRANLKERNIINIENSYYNHGGEKYNEYLLYPH
jgi:hypothetical protein